jgi:hypothetical protein
MNYHAWRQGNEEALQLSNTGPEILAMTWPSALLSQYPVFADIDRWSALQDTDPERFYSPTDENPSETLPDGLHEPRRRRSSPMCSYASSCNSSLRGDQDFDNTYQWPEFSHGRSGSVSSHDIEVGSPSLLPPQYEPQQQETKCDVCGMKVKLGRRRDWQQV